MANTRLSALTGLSTPASGDEIYIIDVSDTTDNASGSSRKITLANLFAQADEINTDLVTPTGTQTLTNKTLTAPVIATIVNTGTLTLPTSTDTLVGKATTDTLTNKSVTPKVVSATSITTSVAINADITDMHVVTAQAEAILYSNPTGTLVQGQKLIIRIKDNATARAITWGANFRAMGTALPTTTVLSKTKYLGFIFNSTDTKWDLVAAADEA